MKCPECGANLKKISPRCEECGAQLKGKTELAAPPKAQVVESTPAVSTKAKTAKPTPSLIEFPGINRNALPEWRKELSERVREK
jgi:predicted amidophosphoribosyltransferase